METIKQVLMRRDNLTLDDAEDLIFAAVDDLQEKLIMGENADDICQEWFGLEPDYLFELIEYL